MRIKKKFIYWALIIIIAAILAFIFLHSKRESYGMNGYHIYYDNRGTPEFTFEHNDTINGTDVYSVSFDSRPFMGTPTKIWGEVVIPNNEGEKLLPGLVLLPGGGATALQERRVAIPLSQMGYIVMTIDQRGVGKTGGVYLSPEQDYNVFAQGKEPMQHLAVYDALKSVDVLREVNGVDKNNVAIGGESMGGRYAMIAAAIDKNIKGAMIISSSGFHFKNEYKPYSPYLLSIDPDQYVAMISPRPLFMVHGTNDTTIPLQDAQITFSLAKEPKDLSLAEGCGHGYCAKMHDLIKNDLKEIFS